MSRKVVALLGLLLIAAITSTFATFPAYANETIQVVLNATQLVFDVPPQIINDRTMIPIRVIFESLGATVEWDADTKTIRATRDRTLINLQIDHAEMIITPNTTASATAYTVVLDVPPQLVDGRTLVPVRAIAEGLNAKVEWDGDSRTVVITQGDGPIIETPTDPAQVDPPAPRVYYAGDTTIPSFTAIVGARKYEGMESEINPSIDGSTMYYYNYSEVENPKQDAELYRDYLIDDPKIKINEIKEFWNEGEDNTVVIALIGWVEGTDRWLPITIAYGVQEKEVQIILIVTEETSDANRVGGEGYGYITIPAGWAKFADTGLAQADIAHIGFINHDGSIINFILIGSTTASLEQVVAASTLGNAKKTTLDGFEAYQLSAYFDYDDTYLYMWYFFDQDGTLHNITAEGPSDKIEQVVEMIEATFSLTQ